MLSIFKIPLVRHVFAGVIIMIISFFIGRSTMRKILKESRKQTNIVTGKYKELNDSYEDLKARTDTLQKHIILIAKIEKIKIDNNIIDTKVKDGATLSFTPTSKASILNGVVLDSVKKDTPPKPPVYKIKARKAWNKKYSK